MSADDNLVHGTCVAIGEAGVLIRGRSGAGKSDLALRLLHAGRAAGARPVQLVGDDRVQLLQQDGALIARTAPNLANKLEIRGIGIVSVQTLSEVQIRLVVDDTPREAIARLPEDEDRAVCLLGVYVARLALMLLDASAVAKVITALDHIENGAGEGS